MYIKKTLLFALKPKTITQSSGGMNRYTHGDIIPIHLGQRPMWVYPCPSEAAEPFVVASTTGHVYTHTTSGGRAVYKIRSPDYYPDCRIYE